MLEGRVQTVGADRPKLGQAESSTPRWLDDQRVIGTLFVLPALAILAFVVVYPFFTAISMSFQNKMVGAPGSFIGFGNYVELFGDRHFLKTIKKHAGLYGLRCRHQIHRRPGHGHGARPAASARLHLPHHPVRALGGADHRRSA